MTLSLIGSLVSDSIPLIMGAFADPNDPAADFREIIKLLREESAGARAGTLAGAHARGSAIGQNYAAAYGNAGLGATGVGAQAQGLASSYAGDLVARTGADFDARLLEQAAGVFAGGQFSQPSRYNQFLAGLGPIYASGEDPFESLIMGALQLGNRALGGAGQKAGDKGETQTGYRGSPGGAGYRGSAGKATERNPELSSASPRRRQAARFDLYNRPLAA